MTPDFCGNWQLYTPRAPQGVTMVGTIRRGTGDTGALGVIDGTGLFVQVNAGAWRLLPSQGEILEAYDAHNAAHGIET